MTTLHFNGTLPLVDAALRRREEIRSALAEAEYQRQCAAQAQAQRERAIAELVANLVAEYEGVEIDAARLDVQEHIKYAGAEARYTVALVCEDAPNAATSEYLPSIYLRNRDAHNGWTLDEFDQYPERASWLACNEMRDRLGHTFTTLVDAWLWVYEGIRAPEHA